MVFYGSNLKISNLIGQTFQGGYGKAPHWIVVIGKVLSIDSDYKCFVADAKSDFKQFSTLEGEFAIRFLIIGRIADFGEKNTRGKYVDNK